MIIQILLVDWKIYIILEVWTNTFFAQVAHWKTTTLLKASPFTELFQRMFSSNFPTPFWIGVWTSLPWRGENRKIVKEGKAGMWLRYDKRQTLGIKPPTNPTIDWS